MAGRPSLTLIIEKTQVTLGHIHVSTHRQCDRMHEAHAVAHRMVADGQLSELDRADFNALHAMLHGEHSDNLEADALVEAVLVEL